MCARVSHSPPRAGKTLRPALVQHGSDAFRSGVAERSHTHSYSTHAFTHKVRCACSGGYNRTDGRARASPRQTEIKYICGKNRVRYACVCGCLGEATVGGCDADGASLRAQTHTYYTSLAVCSAAFFGENNPYPGALLTVPLYAVHVPTGADRRTVQLKRRPFCPTLREPPSSLSLPTTTLPPPHTNTHTHRTHTRIACYPFRPFRADLKDGRRCIQFGIVYSSSGSGGGFYFFAVCQPPLPRRGGVVI